MPIPTSLRIAALSMLLALLSNGAVVAFIHVRTHDAGLASVHRQLSEQSGILADIYRSDGARGLVQAVRDAGDDDPQAILSVYRDGRRIAGGAAPLPALKPGFRVTRTGADDIGTFARRLDRHVTLVSGRTLGDELELQRTLERSLLLSLALSVVFGLIGALLIARFVGGRVAAIAHVIEHVGDGDLGRRVPAGSGGDAFDALAHHINAMLDRIVALMDELRLLTDSLAHDLRSPIGRLRARIERALTTQDTRHRDQLLGGVLEEADAVTHMLTTVLEIGRTEAMHGRQRFVWLDPVELIDELAEMYEPLVEEAGTALDRRVIGVPLPVPGHRQLLAQAISNLIDNALKHGGAAGPIMLGVATDDGELRIEVADRGPGIPPDRRHEALRRFGRLDPSRSVPGAGLGLALVGAVAHLHGGRLELGDAAPGLRASLILPVRTRLPDLATGSGSGWLSRAATPPIPS